MFLAAQPPPPAIPAPQSLRPPAAVGALLGGLEARVWSPVRPSSSPRLVVVLHGDLAGRQDSYQYVFAARARDALDDTVVVAILRPGYADESGVMSKGEHGLATGDNYTPEVIAALERAINDAKLRFHARDVTLVGHSGGAALAADLAEAAPSIAARLLLVSCPCDLRTWRSHMAARQLNPAWLLPVRSQSPQDGIGRLSPRVSVRLVVGEGDVVAPPGLSLSFASQARSAGRQASVVVFPNAGHALLLDPRVLEQLKDLQALPLAAP